MAGKQDTEVGVKRASTAPEPEVKKRKRYEEKPDRANRREERREVMAQAKATWEQLRPKATSKEKSVSLVNDLLKLLSGRIVEFVFRHDGSRIVQWMLTDGDKSQKVRVMKELIEGSRKPTMEGEMPFFVKLACDRYGHHLAFKMLRVADKEDKSLIYENYLRGNVSQLIRNSYGADVLDFAFQTVLKAKAKSELVLELLYMKDRKLLEAFRSKMVRERSEKQSTPAKQPVSIFAQSLEVVDEAFADAVVDSATTILNQLVDKETLLRFEIIHAALKEYMTVVMASYPKEKAQEMAVLLGPVLVHFAHTKPGIFVAVNCVKILDAKHRKKVVRSLKTHIRKLLEEEYGHRLILALFEWVDDTRLVGKTISAEIFSNSGMAAEMAELDMTPKSSSRGGKKKAAKKGREPKEASKTSTGDVDLEYLRTMCQHKYARIPVLSLFFGRDTRYFNPDVYGLVWGDIDTEKFGQLSKKDADVRRRELRMMFDSACCELMRKDEVSLLQSHWSAPMVLGALLNPGTSAAVKSGLKEALKDEGTFKQLTENMCARKTVGTMFKVGGKELACDVIDECGMSVMRKFAESEGCLAIAQNLANSSERADAKHALKAAGCSNDD